jgi:hypothetical protein
MVELLTVIAIIAVLATLLLTALANGKKKSHRLVCTSNLRQISLALNMYLDDYPKRPPGYESLISGKYLAAKAVLLCPEDKTGNWGGIVGDGLGPGQSLLYTEGDEPNARKSLSAQEVEPVPYSYLHPLPWEDWAWNVLLELGSGAGISACQLHGLGKPDPAAPSIYDYEGLVLRARRDGAVIKKRVYWGPRTIHDTSPSATSPDAASPTFRASQSPVTTFAAQDYPWQFFVDEIPGSSTNVTAAPPSSP